MLLLCNYYNNNYIHFKNVEHIQTMNGSCSSSTQLFLRIIQDLMIDLSIAIYNVILRHARKLSSLHRSACALGNTYICQNIGFRSFVSRAPEAM